MDVLLLDFMFSDFMSRAEAWVDRLCESCIVEFERETLFLQSSCTKIKSVFRTINHFDVVIEVPSPKNSFIEDK